MQYRQIILDTETTGLSTQDDHRIIEIAAVEMVNRKITGRNFHQYIQPQRAIDPAAFAIHGISTEFLADKPLFPDVMDDFLTFVEGAELIIHNATFDLGFLNYELGRAGRKDLRITDRCTVIDTLQLARKKHPGQHNNLDALCKRYAVDNSGRELHGALLDAHLLGAVYLAMTGGQISLFADTTFDSVKEKAALTRQLTAPMQKAFKVIPATAEELIAHKKRLEAIKLANGQCLWVEETL